MSKEFGETIYSHQARDKTFTIDTGECKFINMVRKLKDRYPRDVDIHENADGSINARLPVDWMRIVPKKRSGESHLTAEQKQARLKRLQAGRKRILRSKTTGIA